ncbi:type II toxin-antitoxin system ParD family antitoxin [Terasakiella pusilla]|uniref:type II toxin-antitoxin system ParD family antitoxin n=1 Tax=Terasakiella pusilla TaxID=64973 RepID=UPI0005720523|nr:type II toxin-antitoxin system ParD family antitoxin [Terasakiella pusilla]
MNISLSDKMEEFVRAKVASGSYNNNSEVVRDALRLMQDFEKVKLEQLRAMLDAGERQLAGGEFTVYKADQIDELLDEAGF